ncbi:Chitobiosyldiphosphodolichol beta-mannosyltransferase [Entamoeba marina]
MHTVLLVLGDIGRSPRMEFHAIELSKQCPVSVVCYEETAPLATIQDNKEITLFGLRVMSPLKAIPFRTVVYLLFLCSFEICISFNPTSLLKILTGCSVVVDWHNTAYSIVMNVHNLKETSFIIRLLKFYELSTFPDITKPFIDELVENNTNIVCGVSSTSWTPDEDFGCVIPVWLEHEDYPKLLAACQFGISLHQSSSKLDLPMKVLDMFGCALPVLARGYPTIRDELVEENKVGFCFDTAEELNDLLVKNLSNSKQREKFLEEMKQTILFPQSTPPHSNPKLRNCLSSRKAAQSIKLRSLNMKMLWRVYLKQVDTMRKAKHETDYLIDENTKLKKQVTELQTELETTKQNWMDDVTQRLNEIHELKSMNSKLQTSLGVLIKENETKQQLTTMVDKLEGDNDVTIQPMDLSVSDIPVKDDKLESFECPFVGNTYYSPSINLEDDEDHISDIKSKEPTIIQNNAVEVSDINTESVLIKQKKWRDPITIQKKQKGILKPRLPITLKPLSPPKPRIALSGINDKSKNKIAEIIKRKGGIYCESIDENITHLIAYKRLQNLVSLQC